MKLTQIARMSFLAEASFGLQALSLPASVCVSVFVCLCVNPDRVHIKTHHLYKPEPPNLDKRCMIHWRRFLSILGVIDLDLQGLILCFKSNNAPF